jgi:chaperonin cofactor prefoldin
MGGVMVEVSDREALVKELDQTLTALKEHLERFAGREAELLATYDQLKQMLSGSENA